jgi:hypothetical protein
MSKVQKKFTMILHIMIKHNPKKRIEKKIFFSLYYGGLEYICMKKIHVIAYSKMKIYSKND